MNSDPTNDEDTICLSANLGPLPPEPTEFDEAKAELIKEFLDIIEEVKALTPGDAKLWRDRKAAQAAVLEACASQDEFDVDWVEGVAHAELARRELFDAD
jgi:hypothetical protein